MFSVWKFPLTIADEQEIEVPVDTAILSVGCQNCCPVLWALVNTASDHPKEKRTIIMRGTGHPITDEEGYQARFIGTIFPVEGLVFHLFELEK